MMQLYEGGGERGRIVNWIQFCEPNGWECPRPSSSSAQRSCSSGCTLCSSPRHALW